MKKMKRKKRMNSIIKGSKPGFRKILSMILSLMLINIILLNCDNANSSDNSGGSNSDSSETQTATDTPTQVLAYTINATDNEVVWAPVTDAVSYNIYYSQTGGVTKTNSTTSNSATASFIHTVLTNGDTWYYRVSAVDANGESDLSVEKQATVATSVNVGANVVTTVVSDKQITFSWPVIENTKKYGIGIRLQGDVSVTYVSTTETSYTFDFIENGSTYEFEVYAQNYVVNAGSYFNQYGVDQIVATPNVLGPLNAKGQRDSGQITLTWDAFAGALSYNVYYSTSPDMTIATGTKITSVTSPYVHTGLTNGTDYYYLITAETAGGESEASALVRLRPDNRSSLVSFQHDEPGTSYIGNGYSGPGADGNWLATADNPGNVYHLYTYTGNGQLETADKYGNGADTLLRNAGDNYMNGVTNVYDMYGRLQVVKNYDITMALTSYQLYEYDASERLAIVKTYTADPGLSLAPALDYLVNYDVYTYNASDQVISIDTYHTGLDKLYATTDDYIQKWVKQEWDVASGKIAMQIHFKDSGADASWHTNDDTPTSVQFHRYSYDANGDLKQDIFYDSAGAPGADGIYGSSDDSIAMVLEYTPTANRYFVAPGVDAVWLTADDVIGYYLPITITSDTTTKTTSTVAFDGIGADNIWGTADDVPATASVYYADQKVEDLATGNLLQTFWYSDNGADNLWWTADDTILRYLDYEYVLK